ncbi:hypothetical protein ABZ468_49180 [Streptomyces sp. NPDC005708]|uniref:hypothetical protein n=1 Tax=Streptomyces sp. NPDC005708 TaxID=3154564 RepID=UPI0033F460A5
MSASIPASRIRRILADLDLEPHKVRWPSRRDIAYLWERAKDTCELYRGPPAGAIVLSVGGKAAIRARERRHPLPAPGAGGRPTRVRVPPPRHRAWAVRPACAR